MRICIYRNCFVNRCRHDCPRWSELPTLSTQPQQFHIYAIAYSPRTAAQTLGAAALLVALKPQITSTTGSKRSLCESRGRDDRVAGGQRGRGWPESIYLDAVYVCRLSARLRSPQPEIYNMLAFTAVTQCGGSASCYN